MELSTQDERLVEALTAQVARQEERIAQVQALVARFLSAAEPGSAERADTARKVRRAANWVVSLS